MPKVAEYLKTFREIVSEESIQKDITTESGQIKYPISKSADVVTKIVKFLLESGFKVTNNTIYTRIRQAKTINELLGICEVSNETHNNSQEENEKENSRVDDESFVKVPLSGDQFKAINPFSRLINGRTRTYPTEGWTDTVQNVLSDVYQTPCAFRYKFISIKNVFCSAECTECKMKIHTYLDNKTLAMEVINPPDESVLHKKSRQLRGELRNVNTKDSAFNHYNLAKLTNADKNVNTPSLNVYQKAMSEKRLKERSLVPSFLQEEFEKSDDQRFVQQQSLCPVNIILINKEQVLAFQNQKGYKVLSIDETQGIVNLPSISSVHRNQPIGLFTLMMQRKNFPSLPIGQLLSNSRKSMVIQNFLNVWRDTVGVNLKISEVIMDQDFAEAEATCIAFNNVDLKTYSHFAFFYVQDPTKTFNYTLIRFDRNHLTKTFVSNSKKLKLDKVFNSALCLMIDETKFDRIVVVFGCLFALSQLASDIDSDTSQFVGRCYDFLQNYVKLSENDDDDFHILFETTNLSEDWYNDVCKVVLNELEAEEIDASPNNDVLRMLNRYSSRVFIWTAVIPKLKNSKKLEASTATNESLHRTIKNSIFKDIGLPCEINVFIERMNTTVKSMALPEKKLLPAKMNNESLNKSIIEDSFSSSLNVSSTLEVSSSSVSAVFEGLFPPESAFHENPRMETNFKGCNPIKKQAKKFSYLRRQPESQAYYRKENVLINRFEGKYENEGKKEGKIIVHSLGTINSFLNMIRFASEESVAYKEDLEMYVTVWKLIIDKLDDSDSKNRMKFLGELYVAILRKMKGFDFTKNGRIWNGEIEIEDLLSEDFFDFWASFKTPLNASSSQMLQDKMNQLINEGYGESNLIVIQNEADEKISLEKLPISLNGYSLSGAIIKEKKRSGIRNIFIGRLKDGRWIKFDDLEKTTKLLQLIPLNCKMLLYLSP